MGNTCEQEYDACAFANCTNGGTCIADNPSRSHACECVLGYTGPRCTINIDNCIGHDCTEYQVCVDGVNSHTCQCPLGFTGI